MADAKKLIQMLRVDGVTDGQFLLRLQDVCYGKSGCEWFPVSVSLRLGLCGVCVTGVVYYVHIVM